MGISLQMKFAVRAPLCVALLLVVSIAEPVAQDQDIVRVDASGRASGMHRGSGFVWQTADSVVTALHVVAGCTGIRVRYSSEVVSPQGAGIRS